MSSSIRRAVLYSSATRYSIQFIGLASTMVIARLLSPEEIGTFAIASAIVLVMSEFRLLGAGAYLVREQELSDDKIRSATGLTVMISWGLGVLIWLGAPWVAAFYQLEPLSSIFRILSVSFFVAPFISIPTSMLMRSFQFKEVFVVRLYTALANVLFTISLILAGFSYYALAWGYTLAVLVELLVLIYYRPAGMPWGPSFQRVGTIARFGIYTSLAGFLRKGVVTVPDMIIGKLGTPLQVGLFSRGLGFIEFVSQTLIMGVKPVVLPYLSDVKRSGGDINQAYLQASVMLGGLIWPVLAVASVVSLPAIYLFFGDQWLEAAPYASLIAWWAIFRMVHWFSSDLLMARGFEKVMVIKEAVVFFAHFLAILLLFPLGLKAVAAGFAGAGAIDLVVTSWVLWRYLDLNPALMVRAWGQNALIMVLCGLAAWGCYEATLAQGFGMVIGLVVVAISLPVIWLALIFVLRHPLRTELIRLYSGVRPPSANS